MADLQETLQSILGDREAMGRIMALANSLSGGPDREEVPPPPPPPEDRETAAAQPDLGALLGNLDPGMIQMGLRLVGELQGKEDRNAALLAALRPFLREERRARLDRALQIARVTRMIRMGLEAMGEKGDEARV